MGRTCLLDKQIDQQIAQVEHAGNCVEVFFSSHRDGKQAEHPNKLLDLPSHSTSIGACFFQCFR